MPIRGRSTARKSSTISSRPKNPAKPEIHGGFALAHWNGSREIEEKIKNDLKVTIRCIPLTEFRNPAAAFSQAKRAQNEWSGLRHISGLVDVGMRVVLPLFMSNELTLYSRECARGASTPRIFCNARGYKFTEIDVGRNRAAYEEMKELSDQSYVPTLVAGEEVLANFDIDQLEKFLDEHRIEP